MKIAGDALSRSQTGATPTRWIGPTWVPREITEGFVIEKIGERGYLGAAVAAGPDWNGDGLKEILVGAPETWNTNFEEGDVCLKIEKPLKETLSDRRIIILNLTHNYI